MTIFESAMLTLYLLTLLLCMGVVRGALFRNHRLDNPKYSYWNRTEGKRNGGKYRVALFILASFTPGINALILAHWFCWHLRRRGVLEHPAFKISGFLNRVEDLPTDEIPGAAYVVNDDLYFYASYGWVCVGTIKGSMRPGPTGDG